MPTGVKHSDLVRYGQGTVNLGRRRVDNYRNQVKALRDRLEREVEANPGFALVKLVHSGSVAKGTALSTINDMDVAVYVRDELARGQRSGLLNWFADRLREANPQMHADQFNLRTHCVSVNFRGSGLDVDVVPVLYRGDPDDRGFLLNRENGTWLETSIPLHMEFIRKRSRRVPRHFSQVIRLLKWWARLKKEEQRDFRFKSFMVELICAHLLDSGKDFKNYPRILQEFFAFVVKSRLETRIIFTDYYNLPRSPAKRSDPIEIFDPVNPTNNVASGYSDRDRARIVDACAEALDALTEAEYADTRESGLEPMERGIRLFLQGGRVIYGTRPPEPSGRAHAAYLASKVASDLKQLQLFYGEPTGPNIDEICGRTGHPACQPLRKQGDLRVC